MPLKSRSCHALCTSQVVIRGFIGCWFHGFWGRERCLDAFCTCQEAELLAKLACSTRLGPSNAGCIGKLYASCAAICDAAGGVARPTYLLPSYSTNASIGERGPGGPSVV